MLMLRRLEGSRSQGQAECEELDPLPREVQARNKFASAVVQRTIGKDSFTGYVMEIYIGLKSKQNVYLVKYNASASKYLADMCEYLTEEEVQRFVVPGPRATLKFCLEADVPEGGITFGKAHTLEENEEEGKSRGHWRSFGHLELRPDGTAVGQFLSLCSDFDGSGHGHRSSWKAKYRACANGSLCLFDFNDSDSVLKRELTELSRQRPRKRPYHYDYFDEDVDRLQLSSREQKGCRLGPSLVVGSGAELERVQAAQKIAQTRYHPTVFHDRYLLIEAGECDKFKTEHASKVAEWAYQPRRVLTVHICSEGSQLKVTCTGMNGNEECAFCLDLQAKLQDLRAQVSCHVGAAFLALGDGLFLAESEDQSLVFSLLLGSCFSK